jgi:hypothetical protein
MNKKKSLKNIPEHYTGPKINESPAYIEEEIYDEYVLYTHFYKTYPGSAGHWTGKVYYKRNILDNIRKVKKILCHI